MGQHQGAGLGEELVEPKRVELARRVDAVKIDVEQVHLGAAILVDEGERRAGHIVLRSRVETFGDAFHQRGLAGAEIAAQDDHAHRLQRGRQFAAQRHGLFGRVRDVLVGVHRGTKAILAGWFGGLSEERRANSAAAHPPMRVVLSFAQCAARRNASGRAASKSVATRECSPMVSAATSPASPCRYTAATAARGMLFGICAITPAVMPVRMSPVPPVAMPGLPVGLTHAVPSGSATMVRLPFSTSTSRCSRAKLRATLSRSACNALMVIPASRDISPGWGVSTSGRSWPSSRSVWPSKALSPSASMTIGILVWRTAWWTNCAVSGSRPIPGPRATTVIVFASFWKRPLSMVAIAMPPPSVSASGSVIDRKSVV